MSIAIAAFNLPPFHKLRGELRWNPQVLELDTWGQGDMFRHDGTDWSWFNNSPGEISLFLDYPDSLPARTGSGEIILFRFKPRQGVTSGSTELVFNRLEVIGLPFRTVGPQRAYGGVITVSP